MKYPEFVNTKKIVIDDAINEIAFRYSLKIPLEFSGQDSILVIMMNPAEADSKRYLSGHP